MLTTLNIVIGLVFVLLLFSLLASTLMEVMAAIFSLRARNLRHTMEIMLSEKMDDFLRHPLFRQLSYATNKRARLSIYSLPGSLSKDTFTAILQDIMDAQKSGTALEKKVENLDEGDLKRMMQFLLRQSGGNPAEFKAQAGLWFDEVMERKSEWYKRNVKWWLFSIGLFLAVAFNADTIQIYQSISSSATMQNMLLEMASGYVESKDSVAGPDTSLTIEQSIIRMDSVLQQIDHIRSPLGLGWEPAQEERTLIWWLMKLVGFLLTAVAVTLGAPFWYDLLKKLLRVREGSNGKEAAPPASSPSPPPTPRPMPNPGVGIAPSPPSGSPDVPPPATDWRAVG